MLSETYPLDVDRPNIVAADRTDGAKKSDEVIHIKDAEPHVTVGKGQSLLAHLPVDSESTQSPVVWKVKVESAMVTQ